MTNKINLNSSQKKWSILLFLSLILIIVCICVYSNIHKQLSSKLTIENKIEQVESSQNYDYTEQQSGNIVSILCYDTLTFMANQKMQKVNLYNPKSNKCSFIVTLIVDQDTLFKSEMIAPNSGIYEIELSKELTAGQYSGCFIYEYFSTTDLSPMNGGSFHFDLTVQ